MSFESRWGLHCRLYNNATEASRDLCSWRTFCCHLVGILLLSCHRLCKEAASWLFHFFPASTSCSLLLYPKPLPSWISAMRLNWGHVGHQEWQKAGRQVGYWEKTDSGRLVWDLVSKMEVGGRYKDWWAQDLVYCKVNNSTIMPTYVAKQSFILNIAECG